MMTTAPAAPLSPSEAAHHPLADETLVDTTTQPPAEQSPAPDAASADTLTAPEASTEEPHDAPAKPSRQAMLQAQAQAVKPVKRECGVCPWARCAIPFVDLLF